MCDRYWDPIQQSESDEPLLIISKAIILKRERRTSKNLPRIDEVDAVVLKVLQPFRVVPLEPHLQSVYTWRARCNPGRLAAPSGESAPWNRRVLLIPMTPIEGVTVADGHQPHR